ncbi:MAG: DDHD family phospholipase [Kaiparowitsia implicata GSE-PSE-MK54-09C]|nr:DDHD family phospholipase [Kaiparowitsia implicata GSE-PSE-MK54-09C]
MPTDYMLFVHGVKTRSKEEFRKSATQLSDGIALGISNPTRTVKPICFFWGDQSKDAQDKLVHGFKHSEEKWNQFWFRDFRTEQILEFVGDAALYLSRHVGSNVVRAFHQQVLQDGLKDASAEAGDRLHLITHSWGTVILFDILFARRWEDERLDQDTSTRDIRQCVQDIRNTFFGLTPNPGRGIPLASIHTMGSPIALFTLLKLTGESSHDLSPRLNELVKNLYDSREGKPLPWRNFAHPGDPIAYPLEGLLPQLLQQGASQDYVQIEDVVQGDRFPNRLRNLGNLLPFTRQRLLPLLSGGDAHGSYWSSAAVAQSIGSVIQASMDS